MSKLNKSQPAEAGSTEWPPASDERPVTSSLASGSGNIQDHLGEELSALTEVWI